MKPERGQPPRSWRGRGLGLVVLVAVAVSVFVLLPPAPKDTPAVSWNANGATVRGAYHIHSSRSDGAGTIDDITEAASRAGLHFVIVTDHGDGTRQPEPPSYRHGVLCVDGVEISTDEGHYVALDLGATPYRLAGTAQSVVEDVTRLGGFGIVAHANSARPSLQWSAWDVPFDGMEWLNADSEWRDEPWSALARSTLTYWARPSATLSSLLDRPQELIARWDQLTSLRHVPVLAGTDAHARLGVRQDADLESGGWYLPVPGYESSFRVFSNHVVLDRPLSGDPAKDAERLLAAIREGRVFTVIDGLAGPGAFEFVATSGNRSAGIGGDLVLAGDATLRARLAAPEGASMVLLRDGATVKQTTEQELSVKVTSPGAYRLEVRLDSNSALPWLFSNPIYVGFDRRSPPLMEAAPFVPQTPVSLGEATSESSLNSSTTELKASGDGIEWRYHLATGIPAGQYAAIRFPASGLAELTRLRLNVSADRPMRLWVQLRRPGGLGERWGRTVYADETDRLIDLRLDTLVPIDFTSSPRAAVGDVDSLLVVVDTVNTQPGSSGTIRLSHVAFAR